MRLPEQRFWDRTRRVLAPVLYLERIENLVGVGTPDVWALSSTGLVTPVELKAVQGWPARAKTRVLTDKYGLSVDQRNWHMTWQQAGGGSAILVGVGGDRQYLFPGSAYDVVNDMCRADFERLGVSDWASISYTLTYGFKRNEN